MPNSRVATYRTRNRTIRRISLRCEAGAHHVETDPLKTASLQHGNKVSKLIEIEIEIEIERARCGTVWAVSSAVQSGTSAVNTRDWLVMAAANTMSTSGRKV